MDKIFVSLFNRLILYKEIQFSLSIVQLLWGENKSELKSKQNLFSLN